jgi:GT2 family glycosyltransferase
VVGVVVLTMGTRPAELAAALSSVGRQRNVRTDVVVVGNGRRAGGLPPGVRSVHLAENVGIPGGRNAGVGLVDGDFILFLDDDAQLGSPDFLRDVLAKFARDGELGLVQPRVDATAGTAPTRWIPRLRKGDPRRSSPVFSCWEGAVVVRRSAFLAAGLWPDNFFYAHEGIDLAFRLWDRGYRVLYAGDVAALHPPINPRRHPEYHHNNARNRVWIARRNLPWPLAAIYVTTWTLAQVGRAARTGEVRTLRPWFAGWWTGWRADPGPRHPLRWSTVWRMTRLGRPPII